MRVVVVTLGQAQLSSAMVSAASRRASREAALSMSDRPALCSLRQGGPEHFGIARRSAPRPVELRVA